MTTPITINDIRPMFQRWLSNMGKTEADYHLTYHREYGGYAIEQDGTSNQFNTRLDARSFYNALSLANKSMEMLAKERAKAIPADKEAIAL